MHKRRARCREPGRRSCSHASAQARRLGRLGCKQRPAPGVPRQGSAAGDTDRHERPRAKALVQLHGCRVAADTRGATGVPDYYKCEIHARRLHRTPTLPVPGGRPRPANRVIRRLLGVGSRDETGLFSSGVRVFRGVEGAPATFHWPESPVLDDVRWSRAGTMRVWVMVLTRAKEGDDEQAV
jgi:hypothetical protein